MTTRPNFLVVGAARSGTTALVEGLRNHPQVFLTMPKEPHYFALHGQNVDFRGPGDDATINRVAVTDYDDYLALYPAAPDYLALGDGSVSTLYYAEAAVPEILRVNPEMRLAVMLRDPVDRAFSSFQYLRARGFEPHEDFMAALDDEPDRIRDNWHHLWHYTAMSLYADGLQTLREGLGAERVGVWFYDDLDRDADATISRVLRFL
ncbi:MAG: sulfotransferase, partial [Geodermatophilaceae bacterium]|nr:sulfotransferase [Geodermatophilaceae bacterium]